MENLLILFQKELSVKNGCSIIMILIFVKKVLQDLFNRGILHSKRMKKMISPAVKLMRLYKTKYYWCING